MSVAVGGDAKACRDRTTSGFRLPKDNTLGTPKRCMDDGPRPRATRRRFLTAVGAAATGLLAGCPGRRVDARLGRETVTPAPVPTATATPPEPLLDTDAPCPGFPLDESRPVTRHCDESGATAGSPFRLERVDSDRILQLPQGRVGFRYAATGDASLRGLRPPWSLQKYVGDQWFTVRPTAIDIDEVRTATGGRGERHWELAVDNEAEEWLDPRSDAGGIELDGDVTRVPVSGLGGGVYAFVVAGWREAGDDRRPVAVGQTFGLDGPRLELTPTAAVQDVTRAGSTITVTADPGLGEAATYTLFVSDLWQNVPSYIPEQAAANPQFRNLLSAYVPSATEVVLHTRRHPSYPPPVTGPFTVGGVKFGIREGGPEETPG
ncbi:hypothetical protein [Haloarcula marina]|uniref:hypothetical protein n=1 Tax=Haloarcula marina TaxID=2961574 RepID=UPI0020B8AD81|nr:hypothetical protein [Halomicroarcula marina]